MREETVLEVKKDATGLTIYLGVPDESFRRFFHLRNESIEMLSGIFSNHLEGKNVEFTELR